MAAPFFTTLPPLRFADTPNKSKRTRDVALVVVHDPEGGFESTIEWVKKPEAKVSYHVLLNEDGTKAVQFVPWHMKAWSCVAFNSVSENISIAGKAGNAWSYSALNKLARVVAFRLWKNNLPATFRSKPVDLMKVPKGFTFHSELGAVGGGHSDPGLTGAKKAYFIAAVKFHRNLGKFRKYWGTE
jgi:N-acetylmuramoyl-L-alanine amidase